MKKILLVITVCIMSYVDANAGERSTSYRNALILAYSQVNSVYEDDNIKLEFYNEQLWATNKTKKTIFIDRAQCFVFHNGASRPMFETSGLRMGGEKASKKGISTKDDVYLTIAPSFGNKQNETYICNLSTRLYGKYTSTETPSHDFTEYDKRLLTIIGELTEKTKVEKSRPIKFEGTAVHHFTEDESINNIGASIAYAFNKNTEEWTSITLTTWVSDVIFAPCYLEKAKQLSRKEKKGFNTKETDSSVIHIKADSPFEFDDDKCPLIVCDWDGNYSKGTFELKPTWKFVNPKSSWKIVNSDDDAFEKRIIRFDGKDAPWGKMYKSTNLEFTSSSTF